MKKNKDWLKEDGSLESDWIISLKSKKWNETTWTEYEEFLAKEKIPIQSYWDILMEKWDRYQRESQLDSEFYDDLVFTVNQVWDYMSEEDTGKYALWVKYIRPALKLLTGKEHDVAFGFFWERKSERELARDLGISRSTVHDYKKSGIRKMKKFLDEVEANDWIKKDREERV